MKVGKDEEKKKKLYNFTKLFFSYGLRPCSHTQFYPTRVPFANGTRHFAREHTASTASGSSGTLRPNQEVFAVN